MRYEKAADRIPQNNEGNSRSEYANYDRVDYPKENYAGEKFPPRFYPRQKAPGRTASPESESRYTKESTPRNFSSEDRVTWESYRPMSQEYQKTIGDNRGKGPRSFKRSDERIREIVCDCFCEDPALDASDIEVRVSNSEIILTGIVEDKLMKRRAEELAESIPGVQFVENRIRIKSHYER